MKKFYWMALFSVVFIALAPVQAQDVKRTSLGLGAEYRTKTMNMEIVQFSPTLPDLDSKYMEFDIEQQYNMPIALLHMRFLENIDLAFLFGLMDYDLTQGSDIAGFGHDFSSDSTNAFGFSGEVILPVTESIYAGFFFEHFTSELDGIEFSSDAPTLSFDADGFPVSVQSVTPDNLKYHETVLTPIIALKWGKFMPYAGPRFTSASAAMDVTYLINDRDLERRIKYSQIESWSIIVGLRAWITDNLSLNAEMETMENESYKIGITYLF